MGAEPLLIALAVAGLLVGATGTWSPCGFSMIETIGPTGHTGGMRTTLAACATFAPFAVVGGALTFGLLGWGGEILLGAGGTVAYVAAAVVAIAAAVAEARGARIVPKVRRQLPVGWRSSVPMPLAAAGYGILLGLGFTTFVLSYGVWALMGVSLALGDPTAGLVAGVAFGLGRAVPIVVLAPLADRRSGERACEAMAMRPGLLRGARAGDAVALLGVGTVLLTSAGTAGAASEDAERANIAGGSDPSLAGPALAYELEGGRAIVERGGERTEIPGSDPAVGGPYAAVVRDGRVELLDVRSLEPLDSVASSRADAVAVGKEWLLVRDGGDAEDVIRAFPINGAGALGEPRLVASARSPSQLSRPAVDGRKAVYALSKRGRSSLIKVKLGGKIKGKRLLSSKTAAYSGPSIAGSTVAYVETTRKRQSVRLGNLGGDKGRRVFNRGFGPPTVWTTAIDGDRVYVTLVDRGGDGTLVSFRR